MSGVNSMVMEKINEITIEVTLNGSSVYRNYEIEDLDNVTDDTYGDAVCSMIQSLRDADKPI